MQNMSANLAMNGTIIKMKGLPFKATPDDVLRFFQKSGLQSDNVLLRRHPDGRPNGEAFVVFDCPDDAQKATLKDRDIFGDRFGARYVRVYPTTESDLVDLQLAFSQQRTGANQQTPRMASNTHSDTIVKMKFLPMDASTADIMKLFSAYKVKLENVHLVIRSDNKFSGEAFVDFENPDEAARAIAENDYKSFPDRIGERGIRLIKVTRKEMQATLALRYGGEGILKMKGIPFKANAVFVRAFFVGYRIRPEGISFIMHADGRPTGMAFIEFETSQEAMRAMEKDRSKFGPEFGDRFCMLQPVGRHEMEKVQLLREGDGSDKIIAALYDQQSAAATTVNPWIMSLLQLGAALSGNSKDQSNGFSSTYSQLANGNMAAHGFPNASDSGSTSSYRPPSFAVDNNYATSSILDAAALASQLLPRFNLGSNSSQAMSMSSGQNYINSSSSSLGLMQSPSLTPSVSLSSGSFVKDLESWSQGSDASKNNSFLPNAYSMMMEQNNWANQRSMLQMLSYDNMASDSQENYFPFFPQAQFGQLNPRQVFGTFAM